MGNHSIQIYFDKEKNSNTQPKYITFDAYGTLVNFQLSEITLETLRDQA